MSERKARARSPHRSTQRAVTQRAVTQRPAVQRASGQHAASRHSPEELVRGGMLDGLLCLAWLTAACLLAGRLHLVMGYRSLPVPQAGLLEPLMVSQAGFAFAAIVCVAWWLLRQLDQMLLFGNAPPHSRAATAFGIAAAPSLLLWLLRSSSIAVLAPSYWEVLWFSAWTGWSFASLRVAHGQLDSVAVADDQANVARDNQPASRWLGLASRIGPTVRWMGNGRRPFAAASVLALLVGGWWFGQSEYYFATFRLGFNDFGHFAQRIANTAAGRGLLLESPVLPPFWDHFNPGLLLLVPLWKVFPDVSLLFAIGSACLAGSSLLIYRLARQLGHQPLPSSLWAAAWLAQPAVGQMNLAYTYSWHPITLAIPLLLLSLSRLHSGSRWWALLAVVLAMSMEEGVIAIVALFSFTAAALAWLASGDRQPKKQAEVYEPKGEPESSSVRMLDRASSSFGGDHVPAADTSSAAVAGQSDVTGQANVVGQVLGLSGRAWLAFGMLCVIGFVLVFQFSGLAEFQRGRFVALGNSTFEIVLSPVLRPGVFWPQLLRLVNVAFLFSLFLPCYLPALLSGRRWLLPAVMPLGVLLVWDHQPATCLAFQYPSSLLPVFWFAALVGSRRFAGFSAALGGLATGAVLSLFVGQMPYSNPTLVDVLSRTYPAESDWRREDHAEDNTWLHQKVDDLRATRQSLLATGRIASHFVGHEDVETVGQYVFRREQLAELPDRLDHPLNAYKWIVLDSLETFQQSIAETQQVMSEAELEGFEVVDRQYGVTILRRAGQQE